MKKINKNTKIAIIGLGYVGWPLALAFSKKFQVLGFDINKKRIDIKIPKFKKYTTELEPTDSLVIEDNGKGMNREQLQNSLKAGFSGNDPINKLGLFGMGFNISTARLGDKTEILTSLKEDDYLYKVTIDFKELKNKGNFLAPIEIIKKDLDEMDKQGTKITI